MRRREFLALVGGTTATTIWPPGTRAQQALKSYRIGYLALLPGEDKTLAKMFLQRLQDLGYDADKSLVFEYRSAEGRADRVAELAAELVRTNLDALVAGFGTVAAKAAMAATSRIPIVFTGVGDPVGAGLVANLSRPGANVTGMMRKPPNSRPSGCNFSMSLSRTRSPSRCLVTPTPRLQRWRFSKSGQQPRRLGKRSLFSKRKLPTRCRSLSTLWSVQAPPVCWCWKILCCWALANKPSIWSLRPGCLRFTP